jgi:hypothetical protein
MHVLEKPPETPGKLKNFEKIQRKVGDWQRLC